MTNYHDRCVSRPGIPADSVLSHWNHPIPDSVYAGIVLNTLLVMKSRRSSKRLMVGTMKRLMTATLGEGLEPVVEKDCAHHTFIPLLGLSHSKRSTRPRKPRRTSHHSLTLIPQYQDQLHCNHGLALLTRQSSLHAYFPRRDDWVASGMEWRLTQKGAIPHIGYGH